MRGRWTQRHRLTGVVLGVTLFVLLPAFGRLYPHQFGFLLFDRSFCFRRFRKISLTFKAARERPDSSDLLAPKSRRSDVSALPDRGELEPDRGFDHPLAIGEGAEAAIR